MSQLSTFLSEASILKSYIPGESASIAVKRNSQIFTASSNVVKTGPIYQHQNYFKILNISSCAPFKVDSLLLNHNESLLAAVGKSAVAIVEVKDAVDFDSPGAVWNCFNVSISLPKTSKSCIKSVLWHPASSRGSQIVILTETHILLYDIVFSLTHPMLVLPLSKFSQLKGKVVSSITFGSSRNFAGAITLYASTACGQIFAVFPFTYGESSVSATKKQLAAFVDDWRSCLQSYEARVPPSAAFASYHGVFAKQSRFVDTLDAKLSSPLSAESEPGQELSFNIEESESQLLGPLAETGPGTKLIHTDAEDVPVLASIHQDKTGSIVITHFAQLIPLTLAIEKPSDSLWEPTKPIKHPKIKKDLCYSKPIRGFGYIIESDDDDQNDDDDFDAQMRKYSEDLALYNAKRKVNAFIDDSFNRLTVLATDSTDFQYAENTQTSFQDLGQGKVLVASGENVLLGDASRAVAEILNPEVSSFDVSYKLIKGKSTGTGFAYITDTIEDTGEYLITCSSAHNPGVFHVKSVPKKDTTPKMQISKIPPSNRRANDRVVRPKTLPAEELRLIKAEAGSSLSGIKDIDPTQFETLELVHDITSDQMRKVGALTKFLLALRTKVEIQFEDLKLQTKDLRSVYEKTGAKEKFTANHERIVASIARQEKLVEREKDIRRKIVDRFEKARAAQLLPLSRAERDWFKELNSIAKTVAHGDERTPDLTARLETLKAEVSTLKDRRENQASKHQLTEMLSGLSLDSHLGKIKRDLAWEADMIAESRSMMEGHLRELDSAMEA